MLELKTLLLGIGAQKAGTTWLADYLSGHPDVYIPPMKELHYFDFRFGPEFIPHDELIARCEQRVAQLRQMSRGFRGQTPELVERLQFATDRLAMFQSQMSYVDFFRKRVGDQKVFAEISPGYQLLDADIYRMMNDIHPDVRFVFVMRDPVDRAWSQFRMTARKQGGQRAEFSRVVSRPQMVMRSDYRRTIGELEKSVPAERVKYLFFESMFTPETITDLNQFLGIADVPANFGDKSNEGDPGTLDPEMGRAAYREYRFVYEYVAEKFGEQMPRRWRETMARYN